MIDRAPPSPLLDSDPICQANLARMIDRLGATTGRNCRDGMRSLPASMFSILDEIDQTVMARRLRFFNDRGEEVTLEIRSRRLFWAGFGQEAAANAKGRSTVVLSHAETVDVSALLRALREFASTGQLSVKSEPPQHKAALEETGLSVASLRKLSDVEINARTERGLRAAETSLAAFAETCRPLCTALLLRAFDGTVRGSGDSNLVEELTVILNDVVNCVTDLGEPTPLGVFFSSLHNPDACRAVLADNESAIALLCAPGQEGALHAAWSDWLREVRTP